MASNKKETYDKLLQTELVIDKLLEDTKQIQVLLLHQYNDAKDAAQVVINHIANVEGTTVSEIHKRLGLNDWNKTLLCNDGTFYLKTNTTLYNLNSSNIFVVQTKVVMDISKFYFAGLRT